MFPKMSSIWTAGLRIKNLNESGTIKEWGNIWMDELLVSPNTFVGIQPGT